jgi:hypothetical protein
LSQQTVRVVPIYDGQMLTETRLSFHGFCMLFNILCVFCLLTEDQPLIITEIALGYQMVKWGAGVHQWQVTLGQLFEQLYVS